MATGFSKHQYLTPIGDQKVYLAALSSTARNDIPGAGFRATVYGIEIDATNNTGEDVIVALWANAAPTPGTTAETVALPGKAGTTTRWVCKEGQLFTDLSAACVKAVGGAVAPSGVVNVTLSVDVSADP